MVWRILQSTVLFLACIILFQNCSANEFQISKNLTDASSADETNGLASSGEENENSQNSTTHPQTPLPSNPTPPAPTAPNIGVNFGVQSSSRNIDWDFDFVEEFDGLADWEVSGERTPNKSYGNQWSSSSPQLMPKLLNGGKSSWGYFSNWSELVAPQKYIGGGTSRHVWRGSKSLSLDLGETALGPSRFGLHFGGGYKEFYLFYMLRIPKNMFPTSIACTKWNQTRPQECDSTNGGVGTYEMGRPYVYYPSWKFNTFNMNCGSEHCTATNETYGPHHTVPMIKQFNYEPFGLIILNQNEGDDQNDSNQRAVDGNIALNGFMDDWWGVEFHIKNIENDTKYIMDIWAYDKSGKATKLMDSRVFNIVSEAHGGLWDQFFFGGNNANSWLWGPSMNSSYYVDDFIIDDKRIGEKYFNLID